MSTDSIAQRLWYGRSPLALLLLPFAALFALIVAARRALYRADIFQQIKVSRPVVVVGNLTVGGTGKTPLVIWLAEQLAKRGYRVGIVLRGYGGDPIRTPLRITADSDPAQVGDEAVMTATLSIAIVVACADRVKAASYAIEQGATLVLTDDGLQHYRLQRDCEIVVVDGQRGFGNGYLLPAGPLREGKSRLRVADVVALNSREVSATRSTEIEKSIGPVGLLIRYRTQVTQVRSLIGGQLRSLDSFVDSGCYAVAAIGNPGAFFASLRAHNLRVSAHVLPDHHLISAADLDFGDTLPVLMTEKDAVKCRAFADERMWVVMTQLDIEATAAQKLLATIDERIAGPRK